MAGGIGAGSRHAAAGPRQEDGCPGQRGMLLAKASTAVFVTPCIVMRAPLWLLDNHEHSRVVISEEESLTVARIDSQRCLQAGSAGSLPAYNLHSVIAF